MLSFFITHLHAADYYQLLAPIPGFLPQSTSNADTVSQYLPGLIKLTIAVAGGLAVIRIIVGGIQYMSTDAFSGKSSAKETIQNALIGLLLAISAFTILNTVNPNLLSINLNIQPVKQGGDISTNIGLDPNAPGNPYLCTADAPCHGGVALGFDTSGQATTTNCSTATPCTSGVLKCPSCIPIPDSSTVFPHLTQATGACRQPGPCLINDIFMTKLNELDKSLAKNNPPITWQVTELYPALGPDLAVGCFEKGTCVRASLASTNPDNIQTFLHILEDHVTANYEYNICPQAALTKFLQDNEQNLFLTARASKFICGDNAIPNTIVIRYQ